MKYRGFVATIFSRYVQTKRGKVSSYSFKLENEDGTEQEQWIGFGFDKPPFQEGDFIEVEATENEKGFLQYIKGSGTLVKNPPARATAKSGKTQNGATAGSPAPNGTEGQREQPVGVGNADRQTQIVLQHSQEMAIQAVNVLLTHDGLPMSEAKSKAGTAKRFDEIVAMFDKLTRKFYDDVVTGQLLTIVAPELVSTAPDTPLPEVATEKPKGSKKVTLAPDSSPAVNQPGVF